MKNYLQSFREQIEKCWDDETISPYFLPRAKGQTDSAGQCTSTCCVLLMQLRKQFPDKDFTLAIGQGRHKERIIIEYHVWIVEIAKSTRNNLIIDVTADQSNQIPAIVYEKISNISDSGVYYIAYEQSHSTDFVADEAKLRTDILLRKYNQNH